MYSRQENIYNYRINEINLKNGANFQPGRVNVFVGANNCGKTQLLKDILAYINGSSTAPVILSNLELSYPSAWEEFVTRYPMDITDTNLGMQQIRHISPTLDAQPITFQSSSLLTDINIQDQQW